MKYRYVLVIGGSGFIGRRIVAALTRTGRRIIVPTRRYAHARELLVYPGVDYVTEANIHDDATLDRLVAEVDAVVNLVGVLHSRRGDPYGPQFRAAHVDLPRRIVAACRARGVARLLHMSALGAAADGPSMYLRSKADGERAATTDPRLGVTVFRPSVVFGEEDNFLNMFAALQRRLPCVPLAGADARFQPVYVGDVARAFANALDNDHTIGHAYELAGPQVYRLRELVRLAGEWSGHPRPVFGMPDGLARLQAMFFEMLPGDPLISRDNLDSMKKDNIAAGPIAPELDIVPTPLEAVAPYYLSGRTPNRPLGYT